MIGSEVLKEKISLYFGGKIKKYDLGLWAMEAYYELMKGDYIEIEKLKIYHFLKIISTFHMPAMILPMNIPVLKILFGISMKFWKGKRTGIIRLT